MSAQRAVTIYDIAKSTGLSPSTISKIINHKGSYPQETIERVFSAVETLGYIPNIKARNLSEKSTNTLGVNFSSLTDTSNSHMTNLLAGIINKAMEYGYNIMVFNASPEQMLDKIHDFDGIIIPVVTSELLDYLAFLDQKGKPFVYVGARRLFDQKKRFAYGGYFDYMKEVIEIYYKKGRKRLVFFPQVNYIDFAKYDQSKLQRLIDDFIQEKKLPKDFCTLDSFVSDDPASLLPVIDKYTASDTPPDGLFFNSTAACVTVYNHLQQLGFHIPEDIAIMSTGQAENEGLEFSPRLSIIHVHAYEMGKRCVEVLMHQIDSAKYLEVDNYVPFTYIERESTQ